MRPAAAPQKLDPETPLAWSHVADLYRAGYERLVRQLDRQLGVDRVHVEDGVQVAFVKYAAGKCRVREDPFGWLYTVARREALHAHRHEARAQHAELDHLFSTVAEPAETYEARQALALLVDLTANQRRALELLIAGHSYREICRITGHTYTWVNRHVHGGRATLRSKRPS